jgi:hypothetical protein
MWRRVLSIGLLAGAAAAACGSSGSPDENAPASVVGPSPGPSTPGGSWPNEPNGLTVLTDWSMDQAIPATGDVTIPGSPGWRVVSHGQGGLRGSAQRVSDPSAPGSPSGVYDFIFPEGMVEGESPATVYYRLTAREVYVGFWWRTSSPFDLGPNGNKIAFLFNGGGDGGGQQFLILRRDGRLHVLPEYRGDYRWRSPNVNATAVTLGTWHQVEWYADLSIGTVKWWLDGVLQGYHGDVRNPQPFDMFQFNPTWGGNSGARKRQTDHYWFDHVRISAR